ncbi:hypothetical protein SVAN01_04979 [Stagonosporopsis vannaccii]|nr:hypothetical protein SVAN01_04979 [Stagonosporopsis vannaccii]
MTTLPSSRGSSLDHTFRPATPESTPVFRRSATSLSIPKSEYLRNALEARRAQNTPVQNVPGLINTLSRRSTAPTSAAPHTPAATPDAFDEFDLPEELLTPESPIRKRRPHEKDTPPRGKTNQELSTEVEKLRDELFKQNLRVELLNNSNHKLQEKWLKAKEEADQLKPLEEENYELRAGNKKLTEKLAAIQDVIDRIDEMNDELDKLYHGKKAAEEMNEVLKEEVVNLTNVNKEAVANMQETEEALNEAVEMITSLEGEKTQLRNEVDDLKQRVATIESKQVDGSGYPQRVHSIDEHRPTTSYDDSDYYSQPATPRRDIEKDTQSIRSKQFIELTKERTRSARSLSKRMSDASLKAAGLIFTGPIPQIPLIPEHYAQVIPRTVDERSREQRYHRGPGVEQCIGISRADVRRPTTGTPTQTHESFGLHCLCRPDQPARPGISRPVTSCVPSGNNSSRPQTRTHSVVEHCPAPPPRTTSRHARTTSDDLLRTRSSSESADSHAASGTLVGSEDKEQRQEQVLAAWNTTNPRTSTVSLLTSPRIDRPDKERWWKDTENVRPLRTRETTGALRRRFSFGEDSSGSRTFAARAGEIRTNPTTPATERPNQDFLFNPREDEEQFMRKAITRLKGSMRR